MKKISIFLIAFLLGGVSIGVLGVKLGYNLPRDPTTEVNVSVDKLKAKEGSKIDFRSTIDVNTDSIPLTRKERKQKKRNQ